MVMKWEPAVFWEQRGPITEAEIDELRDLVAHNTGRFIVEYMEDGRMRVIDTLVRD
jgi:hypothetical protein